MSWLGIAVAFIIGSAMFTNTIIKQRAAQLLTREQDSKVAEVRATRIIIRMFLTMYFGFALIILAAFGIQVGSSLTVILGAACLATWAHVSYFRRIRALNLPPEYMRRIRQTRLITYGAGLAILGIVALDELWVRLTTG